MIWLETDLQENLYPGPHEQCFQMICYDLETAKWQKIVSRIDKFDPEKDNFAGLYLMGVKIPHNIFVNDDLVLWNCLVDGNHVPILINIKETESHTMLDMDLTILDVQGNEIVAVQDHPLVPSMLKYGTLNIDEKKLDLVNLNTSYDVQLDEGIVSKKLIHIPSEDPALKPR